MQTKLFFQFLIGFSCLLLTLESYAQVHVIHNGNVGVGTDSPEEQLHVFDKIKITGFNRPAMIFRKDGFDFNWTILGGVNSGFYIKPDLPNTNSTDQDSYFSIKADGDVGIGEWNPSGKLHVLEDDASYIFKNTELRLEGRYNNDAYPKLAFYNDNNGVNELGAYLGGGKHGNHVRFLLANNNDLAITGGKVGIGTTAPVEELTVIGKAIVGDGTNATPTTRRDLTVRATDNLGGIAVVRNAGLDDYTGYFFSSDNSTPKAHKAGIIFQKKLGNGRGEMHFLINDEDNNQDADLADIAMTIKRSKRVGIGTTSPTEELEVVGDIKASGNVYASCGTLSCSDTRYKKNFRKLENPLSKIKAINGLCYEWNQAAFPDKGFDDKKYLGFKAQEVETQFPEMVHTDREGFKSVDYSRMTVVLLEAVKDQQEMVQAQQAQIKDLQNENELLKQQIQEIHKYLAHHSATPANDVTEETEK